MVTALSVRPDSNSPGGCLPDISIEQPTLEHFASADELKQHLIDQSVQYWKGLFGTQVPYYGQPIYYGDVFLEPVDFTRRVVEDGLRISAAGISDVTFSDAIYSLTNVQVAGVDEGDRVKSDGKFLYLVRENRLTIVDVQDPTRMRIASRVALDGPASEIYVDGNRLTVISSHYKRIPLTEPVTTNAANVIDSLYLFPIRTEPTTQVDVYDITDRTKPHELTSFEIDGNLVQSRAVGSHVVLVTQDDTALPHPAFHCTEKQIDPVNTIQADGRLAFDNLITDDFFPSGSSCIYETEEEYVGRLSHVDVLDFLPHYQLGGASDGPEHFLTAPEKIVATGQLSPQLISTTVIDVGGETPHIADSAGVLTPFSSWIYATPEHVYVAAPEYSSMAQSTRILRFTLGQDQSFRRRNCGGASLGASVESILHGRT